MARDVPQHDPNVKGLGGFDVSSLSVAELAQHGVVLRPRIVHVAIGRNRQWSTHSEYDGAHPDHLVMARAYARADAARHVAAHGKLEGLRLQRSFPCLGHLRVLEEGAHIVQVQCDVCGEEIGMGLDVEPDDKRPAPEARDF